jgi:hypothetical protein
LLASITLSCGVQANTSIISSNIADGSTFNSIDIGFAGQFDLNPYLEPSSNFNVPYQINSAHFDLTFSPTTEYSSSTTSVGGYYFVCQGCIDGPDNKIYQRDIVTTNFNPEERASFSLDGTVVAAGGSSFFDSTSVNGIVFDHYWDSHSSFPALGIPSNTYTYSKYITHSYGYSGIFTLSGDVSDFSTLANTGLLSFNLGINGGLRLLSSTLTVDYNINPVPEPDSCAMLLMGLGLMGFMARRRKADQSN